MILVPLSAGLMILIIAVVAMAAHSLWLFPSYGPSAYLLVMSPGHPNTRLYNVVVGHLHGLGAAFLALLIVGALAAPAVFLVHAPVPGRMWASPLAIALSILLGFLLRAHHPPAAATALLTTLGAIRTGSEVIHFFIGLGILVVVGEGIRLLLLGKFEPGMLPERREGNPPDGP